MGVAAKRPTWSTYKKGDEWWSIIHFKLAYDVGYETHGIKRIEFHTFSKPAQAKAAFEAQVAAWLAEGFVKLTAAEFGALPQQGEGAYLGWIGPFPEDARYFRTGQFIDCVRTVGDALVTSRGWIGKDFGELDKYHHGARGEAIAGQYEDAKVYKPIDREAVITLYAAAKAKAKAKTNAKATKTTKTTKAKR